MEDGQEVARALAALSAAVSEKAKSLTRQRELVSQLEAAWRRKPPNLSAIRRLLDLPAQKEMRESFGEADRVLDTLREQATSAWSEFALGAPGEFRRLAAEHSLDVQGQPPKLSVGRGIEVIFKLKENKTTVNGVSIQTVDPIDVLEKVRAEQDRLWGGKFDADSFMRELFKAYQAEIADSGASPDGVPIRSIYERMRGSLSTSAKKTFATELFAARISRALESGARAPDGRVLELKPVREPSDAIYIFLPDQGQRTYRGLVTFRRRGMTAVQPVEFNFDPMRAIEQFKKGTTPLDAVEFLNVGRDIWHRGTIWYLDEYVSDNRSAVRFVEGAYGAGKTHLLYLTAKAALDRNFVVSYVTAEDAPLSKFDLSIRGSCRLCDTKAMVDEEGLDFNETTNGLKRIIEEWFRRTKINAENAVVDRHVEVAKVNQRVRDAIDEIDASKHWDANFRHAIRQYMLNMLGGTAEGAEQNSTILRWLEGEALPKAEMRHFEVYDTIKLQNSRDMFRSLTHMLREFGFTGLVVLVDELERILEQARKARDKAYQTIRQLVDNGDSATTQSAYILFAITPELLTSERGFKEYDALWQRVGTLSGVTSRPTDFPSRRAVVMNLELTPFDQSELTEMARKIRAVHAAALNWDAATRVTDDVIEAYVKKLSEAELEISRPRVLVRTMTEILERAEEYPDYDPLADVTGEITRSIEALQEQRSQDEWDW